MATTATKLLQLRPKLKSNPSLPLFFSSSSEAPPEQPKTPSEQQPQQSKPFSFSSIAGTRVTSSSSQIEESRKALAGFRSRTNLPPPDASAPPSFRELYNSTNTRPPRFDFNSLRGGLRNLSNNNSTTKLTDSLSLKQLKDSLKLRPGNEDDTRMRVSSRVIGGTEMRGIFRKEEEGGEGENMKTRTRAEFVKMYSHNELGRKLQMLRPPGKKDGFSLQELNDRLVKLREIEDKESESSIAGSIFKDLKASLLEIRNSEDDKSKKSIIQRLDVLGQIGSTPSFMSHPPKEHLVEKYFHPDNMSSEEKMKLELQKVRDEFKMSESDCGSARVQVAQLTTKIKHLSTVLHKKDKHSRKGLQGMVQKRKKLLKYLRKTDWDSYCLVLSKLGLRDNPDYKF